MGTQWSCSLRSFGFGRIRDDSHEFIGGDVEVFAEFFDYFGTGLVAFS